jgi:hypothetical protein
MRKIKREIKIAGIILITIFICYLAFYHYTDSYEFGITYNCFTGEIKPDKHTGHHFTTPWVLATKIDTRPQMVCIASASRNLNCRLVQFDTSQWRELIKFEGFRYYWWYNRFSFNSGQQTFRGVRNLLLGHSYGKSRGSFVKILEEIGDE